MNKKIFICVFLSVLIRLNRSARESITTFSMRLSLLLLNEIYKLPIWSFSKGVTHKMSVILKFILGYIFCLYVILIGSTINSKQIARHRGSEWRNKRKSFHKKFSLAFQCLNADKNQYYWRNFINAHSPFWIIFLVPLIKPVLLAAIRPTFLPRDLSLLTVEGWPMCC